MKKKIFLATACLSLSVLLAGCGGEQTTARETQEVEVTATAEDPVEVPEISYTGYQESKLTPNDLELLITQYFDIAKELAPSDLAGRIEEQRTKVQVKMSDAIGDFGMYLGDSLLHFLAAPAGSSKAVDVINGVMPADDLTPYYLAALLNLHQGVSTADALEEATEAIDTAQTEGMAAQKYDDIYTLVVNDLSSGYYMVTLAYDKEFNGNSFYQTRLDENTPGIASYITGITAWGI